jgi:glutathione S-transferase
MKRYAATLAGFYPSDPLEALTADEAMHCLNEMTDKFPCAAKGQDEKKKLREEFEKGPMTKVMSFLEKRIRDIGGGKGFAKAGTTVADVMLMSTVKSLEPGIVDYISTDFFESYQGISAAGNAAQESEKVAAYYKSLN